MSERNWTDAQRAAIEDAGGALLVSAAAGSGKTAVLVERALRMITREEDPVSAERLLILTFTNAAAEELRSRIAASLEAELRRRPKELFLRKQRLALRRAYIGTLDAFCQQLVKEHFAVLDIPPDITVGDGATLEQLSGEALAATMEEMYQNPAFAAFAGLYGRARSDAAAEETVLRLYAFTRTLPRPEERLRGLAVMYCGERGLIQTRWGMALLDYAGGAVAEALSISRAAHAEALESAGCSGYAAAFEEDAAFFARLLELVQRCEWDQAVALAQGWQPPRLKAAAKGTPEEEKEYLKGCRATAKKLLDHLKKYCLVCTEAEYKEDLEAARPMVEALVEAAQIYGEKLWQAKKAERVLDFADIEHLALGLLQTPEGERGPLAEKLSSRYDAVMVDEYQDTNELQDALYSLFARPGGDNLFYVGDVKQSIYRFRQANPGLFLLKKARWAPHASGQHPAVLTLGHNFRSTQGVVDGVNALFGQLMSGPLGEVEYGEEERLICAAGYQMPGGFEVDMVAGGPEDEAAHVAERIARMVAEGCPVEKDGQSRPAGYGDFCVLMRSRTGMAQMVAALAARGIPAVADRADDLLQTPEVLPLAAALRAIDNPGDDVMLASAMLGPLFRFSAGELAALRATAPRGRLWAAVAASGDEKAAAFAADIRFYRAIACETSVGRLCEELCARTGYLAAVTAMESGAARRENLYRFIGWAGEVSAAGRGGLAGFARILAAGRGPDAPGVRSIPGHVSVLTIHRSKGLEYPVCFVSGGSRAFNQMDLNSRVKLHPRLGIGFALRSGDTIYNTLPGLAIRSVMLREGQSEEMRVLYVAFTRARQQLIYTLADEDPEALLQAAGQEAPSSFGLMMMRSTAAWVLAAARRPACAGAVRVNLIQPQAQPQKAEAEAFRLTATPDEALAANIRAGFEAVPARSALRQVPAKLSVSAIAKGEDTAPRRRPSFMYKEGLTAAERGTAQHAFMQFADYRAAEADLEAELARLVEEAYIDAATAAAVDKAGVQAFLASPLVARMKTAQRVLREYDFITSVPAGQVAPELPGPLAAERVMVQGIADLVLVYENEAEIVDYKTDRGLTPEALAERYAPQLGLYRQAVEKRLGLPVRRLTIWSFAGSAEVPVEG